MYEQMYIWFYTLKRGRYFLTKEFPDEYWYKQYLPTDIFIHGPPSLHIRVFLVSKIPKTHLRTIYEQHKHFLVLTCYRDYLGCTTVLS